MIKHADGAAGADQSKVPGRGSWRWMLHRARYVLRTEGPRSAMRKALARSVYGRVVLFERDLVGWDYDLVAAVPVEVAELGSEWISTYLRAPTGLDEAEVQRRFARQDRCFVTWTRGRISSTVWYATGRVFIPEIASWLELEPQQVYGYDSWTDPGLRGYNIAAARASRSLAILRDEGFSSIAAYVVAGNQPGLRAVGKLGYRRLATMGSVRLGVVRLDFARKERGGTAWRLAGRGRELHISALRAP